MPTLQGISRVLITFYHSRQTIAREKWSLNRSQLDKTGGRSPTLAFLNQSGKYAALGVPSAGVHEALFVSAICFMPSLECDV